MKVIFLKNLRGQGKVNEIKEVSDGYAVNYLIKNGYAVKYTVGSAKRLNQELSDKAMQDEENMKKAREICNKLEKADIKFVVDASKDGKMFGTISVKQIWEELKKMGFDIDKKKIKIDSPINTIGYHVIKLELHKKVICELRINVIRK